jgi:hypothetical protein
VTKERIEDLFSPERLRDSWREEEETPSGGPEQEGQPARLVDDHPVSLALRLEEIVRDRFGGADPEPAIQTLTSRLKSLVERRFSPQEKQEEQEEQEEQEPDQAELDQEISEILGQIEDLAEALSLGERRR